MDSLEFLRLKEGQKVYTDDHLGVEGTVIGNGEGQIVIKWEDHKITRVDKLNQILVSFIARCIRLTSEPERRGGKLAPGRKRRK